MSTLKDVAALAQCSLTTASIVANGRGDEMHISPPPSSALPKLSSSFSTARTAGRSCCGPAGAVSPSRCTGRWITAPLYWAIDCIISTVSSSRSRNPPTPTSCSSKPISAAAWERCSPPSCRAATMASSSAGPASRISFSWKMRIFPPLLFSSMPKAGSIPPPG